MRETSSNRSGCGIGSAPTPTNRRRVRPIGELLPDQPSYVVSVSEFDPVKTRVKELHGGSEEDPDDPDQPQILRRPSGHLSCRRERPMTTKRRPRGFNSARLWLGLATVTLASFGNASSGIDIQAAGQTPAPQWLEPLILDGLPRDGVLAAPGDADYFRLDVTEPTMAAIYTTAGFDSVGTLFDSDGREIASEDEGGEGGNFRIEAFLPRRGTYFLQVGSFWSACTEVGSRQGHGTGSYTLHAERLASPGRLSLGGLPQQGALGTDGEADHFLMDITGPASLAIHTSGGVDTGALLYDPDGGLIAYDVDGGRGPISALTRSSCAAARICSGSSLLTRDSPAPTRFTRLRSPNSRPKLKPSRRTS